MARVCMCRVGYGSSLSWAEFVMGRDVQLPRYRTFAVRYMRFTRYFFDSWREILNRTTEESTMI